jgi:hypothetical protein
VCDGSEVCKAGACGAGTPLNCNDQNQCTDDSCHPLNGCQNGSLQNGTACDDGVTCSTGDQCGAGVCRGTGGVDCNDNNPCTTDGCDAGGACTHVNQTGTPCNDGDACTQADSCQSGTCKGGSPLQCGDGNPCTDDKCDPATGCSSTPAANDTPCTDGNPCNGLETCQAGTCNAGTTADCDDKDPCTVDGCAGQGCTHTAAPDGTACSDGNTCNGIEVCKTGACKPGAVLPCDDQNPCTADLCDALTGGCTFKPLADGASCTDGDACNGVELCLAGACKPGKNVVCDDADPCTIDSCDPTGGCVHASEVDGTPCHDDSVCTQGDQCKGGVCEAGKALGCDDSNACTDDTCDPASGCLHLGVKDGTVCDDGNTCSTGDRCQAGYCVATGGTTCDDGNPCTKDGCIAATGACKFTNVVNGTACDDSDGCTGPDVCQSGTCRAGATIDCADNNPCSLDGCSPAAGCTHSPTDGAQCVDGNPCTLDDTCVTDVCAGVAIITCTASDDCHQSICTGSGFCGAEAPRRNGSPCDGGVCKSGVCGPATGTGGAGGTSGTPDGGVAPGDGGIFVDAGPDGAGAPNGGAVGGGAGGTSNGGRGANGNGGGTSSGPADSGLDGRAIQNPFERDPGGCACEVPAHRDRKTWPIVTLGLLAAASALRRRRPRVSR